MKILHIQSLQIGEERPCEPSGDSPLSSFSLVVTSFQEDIDHPESVWIPLEAGRMNDYVSMVLIYVRC